MASENHLLLSGFIKSVHKQLRKDAKLHGTEEAWKRHCGNELNLQNYAQAMKTLATEHWDNNSKKSAKVVSRVEWIYKFSKEYFVEKGSIKHRARETEIANKINFEIKFDLKKLCDDLTRKIQVLDVGSCYNPLKGYDCFNILPIDIAPGNEDVYKCDFLKLQVIPECPVNSDEITRLQMEYFDMVIFSLFLEYLPSPSQRHLCCEKAYNLLRPEGILIIITPDSKHVGANANIMKSWRFILAKIGFSRIRYEKLSYLHCMVFRKSIKREIAQRWALLHEENQFFQEIVIPQDFSETKDIPIDQKNADNSANICDISLFDELPCKIDK